MDVGPVIRAAAIPQRARLLEASSRWAPARRRRWREQALEELLATAARAPMWRERLAAAGGRFDRLQPLDRETLRDEIDRLRVPTGRPVLRWRTSGSTGRPVAIEQGPDSLGFETAARRRQLAWFGLRGPVAEVGVANRAPADAAPLRRTRERPPAFAVNPWRLDARAVLDGLRGHAVDLIEGVPSQMEQWARATAAAGLDGRAIGARLALVGGEVVEPAQRDLVARVFGCPVAELYGAMEARALATSCPEGSLHVNEELVWLEIVRPDGTATATGEPGEVLVTPLHNHELPLLRYRLGDVAAWRPGGCDCGSTLPRLEGVLGRWEDQLRLADGGRLHPRFLRTLYEAEFGERLLGFHTVQSAPGALSAHLTLAGPPDPGARERLERGIAEHTGAPVSLRIVLEADAPSRRAGKRRTFTWAGAA